MTIIEKLRNDDPYNGVRPSLAWEAADQIERMRDALIAWAGFFEADGDEKIFAAEEAIKLTRTVLKYL